MLIGILAIVAASAAIAALLVMLRQASVLHRLRLLAEQSLAGTRSEAETTRAALSREQGRTRVRYEKRDTAIVPEWQDLRAGDAILDGPPGTAYYVVRQSEPTRSLVLFTDTHLPYLLPSRLRSRVSAELTDALVLTRLTDSQTRVVRRVRMACRPLAFRLVAVPIVLIWGEITARNFLRGVKRRAEDRSLH